MMDKAFSKFSKEIIKAQDKYQKVASDIINSDDSKKSIDNEDKLLARLNKAEEDFLNNIFSVSKKLDKDESRELVNSGWVNENVFSKDFDNHGKRVSTYVQLAKKLGLPAYIGALQANFGNPYETGINDLKNKIEDLNTSIITNDLNIDLNNQQIPIIEDNIFSTQENITLLNINLVNLNDESNILNDQINTLNLLINNDTNELSLEEIELIKSEVNILQIQSVEISNTISSVNTDIELSTNNIDFLQQELITTNLNIESLSQQSIELESEILITNQDLAITIEQVKPGVGQEAEWETVDLDINKDGFINDLDLQA